MRLCKKQDLTLITLITNEGCFKPERFELFVGSKSDKNIYLYKKLGYTIHKTEKYGCGDIEIFYMEKYCKNI